MLKKVETKGFQAEFAKMCSAPHNVSACRRKPKLASGDICLLK
jgi:hypothetical protein